MSNPQQKQWRDGPLSGVRTDTATPIRLLFDGSNFESHTTYEFTIKDALIAILRLHDSSAQSTGSKHFLCNAKMAEQIQAAHNVVILDGDKPSFDAMADIATTVIAAAEARGLAPAPPCGRVTGRKRTR